jgi:hypothetical protein
MKVQVNEMVPYGPTSTRLMTEQQKRRQSQLSELAITAQTETDLHTFVES